MGAGTPVDPEPPVHPSTPIDPGTPVDPAGGMVIDMIVAGHAGGEQIELAIDDSAVFTATLNPTSGFYGSSPPFERLVYIHPTILSQAELRLAFTNDRRIGSEDRNVRVDALVVDGVRFESEDPLVVGTGVYSNGARCRPGTWESEFLNCSGHFMFIVNPPNG